jgi:phosphoribosylformylglycinamidine synthase
VKFGVVVFPGSNCDHDAYHVISKHVGQPVDFIWHRDTDLSSYDAVIIPGGFSYGDYLRAGALARFSSEFIAGLLGAADLCSVSAMTFKSFAAGLLPGALIRNRRPFYL